MSVEESQIQGWKDIHGSVWKVKLETGEIYFVRSPKIKEIEAVQPLLQQGKFITYNISLFKTCYLGGDPIPTDETKLTAASGNMMTFVEVVASDVEKL